MPKPLWLVRPRPDGGCDYVSFLPAQGPPDSTALDPRTVEMREGSHLPPQLPLLKHRKRLGAEEAESCSRRLQLESGFLSCEPLF